MCCYHHFTLNERESIFYGLATGKSIRGIARELNRSPSSVSRELARNKNNHFKAGYNPIQAQNRYEKSRQNSKKRYRLNEEKVRSKVENLLLNYWSPEQICKRLLLENNPIQISCSTIYRGLNQGLLNRNSFSCLRHKGNRQRSRKRKNNCGRLSVEYSIHDRPEQANLRTELGHWESDTVCGRKNTACIATHVERKSRYSIFLKLAKSGVTDLYMNATAEAFSHISPEKRLSFTVDNGKEFASYRSLMKKLGCIVYFADPYCPNQRGTNENTNGLLRQFVPKRSNIDILTQQQIDDFAYLLNTRPRKCLGWKTPLEVFTDTVLHLT